MKKIILLFILAIAVSSCSNDDNQTNKTALEGDWLLVYQISGDPPPGEGSPADISDRNIRYHFNGNIMKITQDGNLIEDELTFTFLEDENSYKIIYNKYPDFPERVHFLDNNTTAIFQGMTLDSYSVLRKIE